jgi:hypothetical protein
MASLAVLPITKLGVALIPTVPASAIPFWIWALYFSANYGQVGSAHIFN